MVSHTPNPHWPFGSSPRVLLWWQTLSHIQTYISSGQPGCGCVLILLFIMKANTNSLLSSSCGWVNTAGNTVSVRFVWYQQAHPLESVINFGSHILTNKNKLFRVNYDKQSFQNKSVLQFWKGPGHISVCLTVFSDTKVKKKADRNSPVIVVERVIKVVWSKPTGFKDKLFLPLKALIFSCSQLF